MKNKDVKLVYLLPTKKTGGVEVAAESCVSELEKHFVFQLKYLFRFDSKQLLKKPKGILREVLNLRNEFPDILVTSLWLTVFVPLLLKFLFRRKFIWIHFIHASRFFHPMDRFFSQLALRYCDEIFVDSSAALNFINGFSNKKARIISLLFDKPDQKHNRVLDRTLIKFLFIGRISAVKNLCFSIDIINQLLAKGYNVEFDIYGPPEDDIEAVKERIVTLGIGHVVHLRGNIPRESIPFLFSQYDFYIQNSLFEGMAMSVSEAMQYGMVCLVSPVGEIANYSEDMVSAIHIDNSAPMDSFLSKIEKCINEVELYKKISQNAFNHFLNQPTYAETFIREIVNILEDAKKNR